MVFSQSDTPVSSGSATPLARAKTASMVCFSRTFSKVYFSTAPTLLSSTSTSEIT